MPGRRWKRFVAAAQIIPELFHRTQFLRDGHFTERKTRWHTLNVAKGWPVSTLVDSVRERSPRDAELGLGVEGTPQDSTGLIATHQGLVGAQDLQ